MNLINRVDYQRITDYQSSNTEQMVDRFNVIVTRDGDICRVFVEDMWNCHDSVAGYCLLDDHEKMINKLKNGIRENDNFKVERFD